MTVRAAALQRTDRLQTSVRVLGKPIGLLAPIRRTFPETSAVGRSIFEPQPPRLEDEVKRELRSGASRIRWSSAFCLVHRPAPCSTSLCCGKRGNGTFHATGAQLYFMPKSLMLMLNTEPDKRAQESVTVCYITCNAAEPHDQCLGGGGTARSFWQGTHNVIILLLWVKPETIYCCLH